MTFPALQPGPKLLLATWLARGLRLRLRTGDVGRHEFPVMRQRAFFGQLARDARFTLAWQHLDPVCNVEASAAIMRGDPEPMREMLDALVRDGI